MAPSFSDDKKYGISELCYNSDSQDAFLQDLTVCDITIRHMTPHALLFTMAAIGISETFYLIRKRIALEKPICPLGEDCLAVLTSKYSRVFGIHTDILGFLFYIAISLIAAFLVIGVPHAEWWHLAANVMIAGGVLSSLALLYIQWKVIRAWCFWCVMSAITIFVMAVIMLTSDLLTIVI